MAGRKVAGWVGWAGLAGLGWLGWIRLYLTHLGSST